MARMTLEKIKASQPKIDRSKIRQTSEQDIVRHMLEDGEDPDAEPGVFNEELPPSLIRGRLGMTQVEFAQALGIPVATLRNWEQGRVRIDPAARALFRLVGQDPDYVMNALKHHRKAS